MSLRAGAVSIAALVGLALVGLTPSAVTAGGARHGCLVTRNGYLRARLRGALDLDLNWQDGEMQCEGGLRPEGRGLRVSLSGPPQSDGRRLRLLFGIAEAVEGRAGRELPTNLTVIFENESRLFSTQGDDKCTTDALTQERVGALGGRTRTWRVVARGFCVAPATMPGSDLRILVTRFDFAGAIVVDEDDAAPAAPRA